MRTSIVINLFFKRLRAMYEYYPMQFWLLMAGMLVSRIGMGMIWPFLTIYLKTKLGLPLTTITALLTLDSIMSIIASFLAGTVTDRLGRKWVMVVSLSMMGIVYALMSQAHTLGAFAILMALRGLAVPMYQVGADAMIADLIPNDQRAEAYSLLRMVSNTGIAIGPAIGGFIAATSYGIAFMIAAVSLLLFSSLVGFGMRETIPAEAAAQARTGDGGYRTVFRDRFFLWFVGAFTMTGMASSLVFALLPLYTKENFQLPETQTGLLMTVNATMVVLFQVLVTRWTKQRRPLAMLTIGALFYAVGIGGMTAGSAFPHFAVSMAVMTIGELIVAPTSTSLASSLAPMSMRGRYMSVFSLGWGISHGLGPVVGGLLNDFIAPIAIWYGGVVWALLSAGLYFILYRMRKARENSAAPQPA